MQTFLGEQSNFAFLGEAGCGKSEIAVNLALALAKDGEKPVHFFDLDMTKPLFRARDLARALEEGGVTVHFEEQFMDAPTTVGGVRRALRDPGCWTVLDVGGDYIGARSVGGYAPWLNRPETKVCYVLNSFRPWTTDIGRIDKVLGEILGVSHIRLDQLHFIANPNAGSTTTPEEVVEGLQFLEETVGPYRPVELLCVQAPLAQAVAGKVKLPLFPIHRYLSYPWDEPAAV